jgi:hypothetical protein
MSTVVASGTVTPTTLGVEQNLNASLTTNATYVLEVDTNNLALGETVELHIYVMVLSGGTERLAYRVAYTHVQGEPIKISPPVPSPYSYRATITQTGGTLRAFAWNILTL